MNITLKEKKKFRFLKYHIESHLSCHTEVFVLLEMAAALLTIIAGWGGNFMYVELLCRGTQF